MKPLSLSLFFIAAFASSSTVHAADSKAIMPSGDAKKLAARYALTKTRIDTLLGSRQHPVALPATALPNPFYRPLTGSDSDSSSTSRAGGRGDVSSAQNVPAIPDAPDLTDADTLTKYAASLKIGGYLTLGGSPHVALNSIICKVGDVITVGSKDHPVFLRIESITPLEFTLKLNEATLTIPIRK
jgi:hypothetical protein